MNPLLIHRTFLSHQALSLLGRLCSGIGAEKGTQAYMERRGLGGFLSVAVLQEVCLHVPLSYSADDWLGMC